MMVTSRYTIREEGTTLANVLSFLGYKKNPTDIDAVADLLLDKGYLLNEAILNTENVVFKITAQSYQRKSFSGTEVESLLREGIPLIGKFAVANQSHFVAITGYRTNRSGEVIGYLLRDPGSRDPSNYLVEKNNLLYRKNPKMTLTGYAYLQ